MSGFSYRNDPESCCAPNLSQADDLLVQKTSSFPSNFEIFLCFEEAEWSKFLTKSVDRENEQGLFVAYKRVHSRLQDFIKESNPDYTFSASLANTILSGALQQFYYKNHFPSLTDCSEKNEPSDYYTNLIHKTLFNES